MFLPHRLGERDPPLISLSHHTPCGVFPTGPSKTPRFWAGKPLSLPTIKGAQKEGASKGGKKPGWSFFFPQLVKNVPKIWGPK